MTAPVRVAPAANVEAPPAVPPVSGLTSLARFPTNPDERWIAGYSYVPELPADTVINRSPVTGTRGDNLGTGEQPALVEVMPWMLEVSKKFSSFALGQDHAAILQRLLEAYTSRLLERELWSGEIAQADNLPNNYLTKDPEALTGTFGPQAAVAELVSALNDAGMGDVMVHVPKKIGILLPDTWRNDSTLEEYGFVVVSGAGYPSSSNVIYATEMVNVRLTEPEAFPGNMNEAFDTRTNDISYYAQRIGAVDFAGPVFSCTVDL